MSKIYTLFSIVLQLNWKMTASNFLKIVNLWILYLPTGVNKYFPKAIINNEQHAYFMSEVSATEKLARTGPIFTYI